MRALLTAQVALSASLRLDEVSDAIVAQARVLSCATCAVLWLQQSESTEHHFLNNAEENWILAAHHAARHVARDAKTAGDADIEVLARRANASSASELVSSADENREKALVLRYKGNVIAVLKLRWDDTRACEIDDRVLESFGANAATALGNARVFEQVENAKCEWETTFDDMADGLLIEREGGAILRANRAAASILGCEVGEIAGRTRDEWGAHLPQYETLRADEFRFGTPSRIIAETLSPLRLARGTSASNASAIGASDADSSANNLAPDERRFVRVLRDITEQRRLEEQLIQSEKLAALGELISGVAHELNNPLTTVSGYAQLLQDDDSLPEHARRQIAHIYQDAARASRIVANLLAFARREETRFESLDINETLRRVAEMRAYQLQAENVRLSFEYSSELPPVAGDEHQLQQVFLNIITNAQQALNEWRGGGTIRLETRRVEVGGAPGVLICIRDNGPGIAPEHLRRIFDPFWTTKVAGEGTGLGMSLSLDIVSRHDGRIWAESTLGQGARFFIELPGLNNASSSAEKSRDEARQSESSTRLSAREEIGILRHETPEEGLENAEMTGAQILVVDDEEPVILLMSEVLGLDDHEITPAFNGGEALALLKERDFDLIISDVRMPAVGGPTFFEILQTARPDLLPRVVFVTGDTMSRSTQDFLKKANRPMLAKPFDPDRLRALVRDQLRGNS